MRNILWSEKIAMDNSFRIDTYRVNLSVMVQIENLGPGLVKG